MTHRFIRNLAAPDHEEIRGFETDPATDPDLFLAAILLAIVAGLFSLAMFTVSFDRPAVCAPYPSAAECIAATQSEVRHD